MTWLLLYIVVLQHFDALAVTSDYIFSTTTLYFSVPRSIFSINIKNSFEAKSVYEGS